MTDEKNLRPSDPSHDEVEADIVSTGQGPAELGLRSGDAPNDLVAAARAMWNLMVDVNGEVHNPTYLAFRDALVAAERRSEADQPICHFCESDGHHTYRGACVFAKTPGTVEGSAPSRKGETPAPPCDQPPPPPGDPVGGGTFLAPRSAEAPSLGEGPWHDGHRAGYATAWRSVDMVAAQRDALGEALRSVQLQLVLTHKTIDTALEKTPCRERVPFDPGGAMGGPKYVVGVDPAMPGSDHTVIREASPNASPATCDESTTDLSHGVRYHCAEPRFPRHTTHTAAKDDGTLYVWRVSPREAPPETGPSSSLDPDNDGQVCDIVRGYLAAIVTHNDPDIARAAGLLLCALLKGSVTR